MPDMLTSPGPYPGFRLAAAVIEHAVRLYHCPSLGPREVESIREWGLHVLDALMQSRRNTRAAQRIFCKLLRDLQCVARVIVTDKLRGYGAANAPSCRTSSTGKAST